MASRFKNTRPTMPDNGITEPINSHVREEAQRLINKQKKDLTIAQEQRIKDWSQGLKAIALLEVNQLKANNACKNCQTKGYLLVRGDAKGINPETKKMEYIWEKTACSCVRLKMTPTDLKGLKYVEATPAKRKPAKKAAKPSTGSPRKRAPKKPLPDTAG
jgi:hypothetical protein